MDRTLIYTQPQARLLRKRAQQEAFQTEDGKPDLTKLAASVGIHRDAASFILTGALPGQKAAATPKPRGRAGRSKAEDILE